MRVVAVTIGATILLVASPGVICTATLAHAASPHLIPLEQLTAAPLFWDPLLSPDGKSISYVALRDNAPNLWVAPANRFAAGRPVTGVGGQGVTTSNVAGYTAYRWTADSARLLYLQDRDGDERWHLMLTDVRTGATRDLTPIDNVQVRLVATSPQQPDAALVEINDRCQDCHDLYLVDLTTGSRRLVYRNDRFIGVFADNDLRPRLGVAGSDDGGFDIVKIPADSERPFIQLRQEDTSALIRAVEQNAWGFSADNRRFRVYDSRARDTWAVVEIDLDSGDTRVLSADDRVDVDSTLYDRAGHIEAWRANWTRAQWHADSPDTRRRLGFLQSARPGDLSVVNRSTDGQRWLVSYATSNRAPEFYVFDADTLRLRYVAGQMPAIRELSLPESQAIVTTSRDGKTLVSYLLLPPGTKADPAGAPRSPLPMVVYVHGGPNDERAVYGYSGRLQWLANRGYAVLNVNYRGSPGFGKQFLNAQNLEWGNKMNLDVADQVHWATSHGIADPSRVGILGGSYGGYEVLVAITKTPEVYACGAALAPSDLESFIRVWWENFIPASNMAYKTIVLGDPETAQGRAALHESSPLYFAKQAKGPVLIAQGGEDTRVPVDQARRMVDALLGNGVPVTYLVYPHEGHGVVRPANRRSFYAIVEAFFGRCLGGAHAPIGRQLDDAVLEIPVGADLVPGLERSYLKARGRP